MTDPYPARRLALGALVLAAVAVAAVTVQVASAQPRAAQATLRLVARIALPDVAGRIDHLAVDVARGRVFVAELGNGTVDAVDLKTGKPVKRIGGLSEPQGLAYLAGVDELAVASGGDGTVRFYRGGDLSPLVVLKLGEDADNLRVDAKTGQLVVGYGAGALAVVDPRTHTVVRTIPVAAHPEGFRLDGARAWVNLPNAGAVVSVDMTSGRTSATWKATHRFNFPMAYEPQTDSVALAYRLPSRLVVVEGASGRVKADLETCGDADDVFYDTPRHRIYTVCGSGDIDVVQGQAEGYRRLERVKSSPGARTGLYVSELDRLIVAAPSRLGRTAALLVFQPG